MQAIDSTNIAAIARQAKEDLDLHTQIVYCPEKVVRVWKLSSEEAHVIRTGDLSKVVVDDETMDLIREMFEIPKAGLADVRSSYRVWSQFDGVRTSELCT